MLAPQSLNPNICGRASRSGWMGEAKRRSVGDRKRAESPTEGHNTLFFFARRVIAAIPTYNTLRYQTKTHTCDRPLRGRDRGDQQSAQGGSLHTPTTDHSTQLITAFPRASSWVGKLDLPYLGHAPRDNATGGKEVTTPSPRSLLFGHHPPASW